MCIFFINYGVTKDKNVTNQKTPLFLSHFCDFILNSNVIACIRSMLSLGLRLFMSFLESWLLIETDLKYIFLSFLEPWPLVDKDV